MMRFADAILVAIVCWHINLTIGMQWKDKDIDSSVEGMWHVLTFETKVPMQEEASSGADDPAAMNVAPRVQKIMLTPGVPWCR